MRPLLVLLLLLSARNAIAQLRDDFSDGDLRRDPEWTGDLSHWQTGRLRESAALQSAGEAKSDTIALSLTSSPAFGRWEFVLAHRDVNLSTFNGVRIFLAADTPDPSTGYYLQIGTNNSDIVSLWRLDGNLSDSRKRVELARSATALAAGDSSHLRIETTRRAGVWSVRVNDARVFEAPDEGRYAGPCFTIWVRHSAAGAASFFLDDLEIDGDSAPPEPLPLPEYPLPKRGDIVINEIQHNPPAGSSEFVELFNVSSDTFDLSKLAFRDSQSADEPISRAFVLIEPGGYAVIVQNGEDFSSRFPGVAFVQPARWPALNNGGDEIWIGSGDFGIDSVAFEGSWTSDHRSLERIDPGGPEERYNFGPSEAGSTPGVRNSIYRPDITGPQPIFAEQADSQTLLVTFNEPLGETSPQVFSVGPLQASGILLEGGFTYRVTFTSAFTGRDLDVGRIFDRKGNETAALRHPIAYQPGPAELVINEIMYEPLADEFDGVPDQPEYIELVNRSDRLLTLGGLFKTREPNESNDADTLSIAFPLTGLAPAEFYVVSDGTLGGALPPMDPSVRTLRISSMGLRNSGDRIRLGRADGGIIDDLSYATKWHHIDIAESRGLSLERIDVDGPSGSPSNWTTSVDPAGGSPGRPNSVVLRPFKPPSGISITPSPFSPDRDGHEDIAGIAYSLSSSPAVVRIRIYDIGGRLVRNLVRSDITAGEGTAYWDGLDDLGRKLRIGVYVVLLEAAAERGAVETHKAVVVLGGRL